MQSRHRITASDLDGGLQTSQAGDHTLSELLETLLQFLDDLELVVDQDVLLIE